MNTQTETKAATPIHATLASALRERLNLLGRNEYAATEGEGGWSQLHFAAAKGDVKTIVFLATKGSDVNGSGGGGLRPIHLAAMNARLEALQWLAANKANTNVVDNDGLTPLHYAAILDNWAVLRWLATNRTLLNERDKHGNTPLHFAAAIGSLQAARILLESGASVLVRNWLGEPIMESIGRWGDPDIKMATQIALLTQLKRHRRAFASVLKQSLSDRAPNPTETRSAFDAWAEQNLALQCAEMYIAGKRIRQIADTLRVGWMTAHKALTDLGLTTHKPSTAAVRADRNAQIIEALRAGELGKDVAERFGVSCALVSQIKAREGLS